MPAAPSLVLHVVPLSHPCLAVEEGLRIKGLAFERVEFRVGLGPRGDEIEACYGPGRRTVPGLLIDDEPVHGSVAILERLEGLVPEPTLFPGGIDGPVGAAARWGEQLQDVGRRLLWVALRFRPEAFGTFGGGAPLDPAGVDAMLPRAAQRWEELGITAVRAAEELGALPDQIDHVDALVADGVLGGSQPTAADLQIGTSLAMLLSLGDLLPLIEGRSAEQIARRWFPDYRPGHIPAGALPAGWVPAA